MDIVEMKIFFSQTMVEFGTSEARICDILPVPGDDDMGLHIIYINNHWKKNKKIDSNINTRNIVWYTPPRNTFITVVKSTPQLELLGILEKEGGGL